MQGPGVSAKAGERTLFPLQEFYWGSQAPLPPSTSHTSEEKQSGTHCGAFRARRPLQEHPLEERETVSEAPGPHVARDPRVCPGPLQAPLVRMAPGRADQRPADLWGSLGSAPTVLAGVLSSSLCSDGGL